MYPKKWTKFKGIKSLKIDISESEPIKYFQIGQLILSFDSKEKLVSVYITNLTEKDIEHVKEELKLHNK